MGKYWNIASDDLIKVTNWIERVVDENIHEGVRQIAKDGIIWNYEDKRGTPGIEFYIEVDQGGYVTISKKISLKKFLTDALDKEPEEPWATLYKNLFKVLKDWEKSR